MSKIHQQIQWYPGHMVKAKRAIEAELRLVDILIEVLDARAPKSSRNPDLEKMVGEKPHILLLNKADLADEVSTKAWLKRYRSDGYWPLKTNAAGKLGIKELEALIKQSSMPMQKRLAARGRAMRDVRAMIVGIPNCGKSTVINALTPRAAAVTGNKPGVTKGRQWVKTAIGLDLLDTPGILWPRFADYQTAFHLAVIGSISDTVFPFHQVASELAAWLIANAPLALSQRYGLKEIETEPQALFEAIGRRRGLLSAGGVVRVDDAAVLLMREFRGGMLGRFTLEKADDANE